MKNPQKGFIVPLLMVIIAVLVIGSGVYVYKNKKTETSTVVNTETQQSGQNQQQTNTQTPPVSATKQLTLTQAPPLFETPILTISPSTTAGWKTYTNDKYKFEFKYPPSFVITDYSFEMSNGSLGLVFTDKDVNFVVRNIELSEINDTTEKISFKNEKASTFSSFRYAGLFGLISNPTRSKYERILRTTLS